MNQNQESTGSAARASAGVVAMLAALVSGVARHADDVGRAVIRNADDFGRTSAGQMDDFGRATANSWDDSLKQFDSVDNRWSSTSSKIENVPGNKYQERLTSDPLGQRLVGRAAQETLSNLSRLDSLIQDDDE